MTVKLILNAILSALWGYAIVSFQSKHWVIEGAVASIVIFSFLTKIEHLEERIKFMEDTIFKS